MKELLVSYRAWGQNLALGTLAFDGRETLFQYSNAAIAQGLELSPIRLPLRAAANPDKPSDYLRLQHLPGLLHDSLPDGWGYRLMHRRMKARGIDPHSVSPLDHLAMLGEHTMGALTYAPANQEPLDANDMNLLELANEVQAVQANEDHEVLAEMLRAGGSPGGARPKALVYFNPDTQQMRTQASQLAGEQAWLVKFAASDDAPDSCALEELYARMARHCAMGMAATRFFELTGGLCAFGTQRFDRQGAQRVHVHSLAGLLHADFQIPSVSYGDFFRLTRRITRDHRELVKAVQRCVFNVLMHNRDDHAKNLSFMLDQNGDWRLAPPYDLTYCPGYRGEHFMDISGEGKAPGRAHITAAALGAGLPKRDTEAAIDALLAQCTPALLRELATMLPIRGQTVAMVTKAMEANRVLLAAP